MNPETSPVLESEPINPIEKNLADNMPEGIKNSIIEEESISDAEKIAQIKQEVLNNPANMDTIAGTLDEKDNLFVPTAKERGQKIIKWPRWINKAAAFAGIATMGALAPKEAEGQQYSSQVFNKSPKIEMATSTEFHEKINDAVKQEWPKYVQFYHDRVHALGLEGNPILNSREFDNKILNEYIKDNEGTALSIPIIKNIQEEFISYKAWLLDKIKNKIKVNGRLQEFANGVTEENFMVSLSKAEGIAGPLTTRNLPETFWTFIEETKLNIAMPGGVAHVGIGTTKKTVDLGSVDLNHSPETLANNK